MPRDYDEEYFYNFKDEEEPEDHTDPEPGYDIHESKQLGEE